MTVQTISANVPSTPHEADANAISRARLWGAGILSGLAALFLVVDGGMKLFKPQFVVEATLKLGYAESTIVG